MGRSVCDVDWIGASQLGSAGFQASKLPAGSRKRERAGHYVECLACNHYSSDALGFPRLRLLSMAKRWTHGRQTNASQLAGGKRQIADTAEIQIQMQTTNYVYTYIHTREKVSLSICHNLWLPTQAQCGPKKKKTNMYMTCHKYLNPMDAVTAKATATQADTNTNTNTDTFVVAQAIKRHKNRLTHRSININYNLFNFCTLFHLTLNARFQFEWDSFVYYLSALVSSDSFYLAEIQWKIQGKAFSTRWLIKRRATHNYLKYFNYFPLAHTCAACICDFVGVAGYFELFFKAILIASPETNWRLFWGMGPIFHNCCNLRPDDCEKHSNAVLSSDRLAWIMSPGNPHLKYEPREWLIVWHKQPEGGE